MQFMFPLIRGGVRSGPDGAIELILAHSEGDRGLRSKLWPSRHKLCIVVRFIRRLSSSRHRNGRVNPSTSLDYAGERCGDESECK